MGPVNQQTQSALPLEARLPPGDEDGELAADPSPSLFIALIDDVDASASAAPPKTFAMPRTPADHTEGDDIVVDMIFIFISLL